MAKKTAPIATQEDVSTKQTETKASKKAAKEVTGYEEWRCEIKLMDGKKVVEKVRMLKKNVKITDEEAETLNRGGKDSPRQDYVIMYFRPE